MLPSADADSAVGRSKTPLSKQLAGPVALLGAGSPLRGWGCLSLLAFGLGRLFVAISGIMPVRCHFDSRIRNFQRLFFARFFRISSWIS